MTAHTLSLESSQLLFRVLQERFAQHMDRHPDSTWEQVAERSKKSPEKLWSLHEMEKTGGEPDVIGLDPKTGGYIFYDCARESPIGRRNCCYDRESQVSRKIAKPAHNALDWCNELGIELLTETQYRHLQQLGPVDTKTSSWIQTPKEIRKLGGALFADYRYGNVFIYHNGASSYYASRAFRGSLLV